MKVPLTWLREYVDINLPVPRLAHRLTMAGLEVEAIHTVGADWRGITIGRVVDLQDHPRADNLRVARVDLGGPTRTVVTAAPNLFVGAIVPHVAPGGRLPAGEIVSRSFQGIESEGMLCSGDELDISPDRDGIYLLEASAPVGESLATYLDEVVFDIYITTNRPDCMSMVGIAREVQALTGAPLRLPTIAPPVGEVPVESLIRVQINDPLGCPRFTASVVRGVKLGPSPHWLQRRLHFSGVRPISNVVNVTNYVMLELGEPLHAFDRQRLSGGIVVRRAEPGEKLVTLDGETRTLTRDMMVVADEARARSLAGIMGGEDSEITEATTEVVLEGASWDRATIRLTSGALNLATEAARRFGRGVDPDLTASAVSRATALTLELAGGAAGAGLVDVYPGRAEPAQIRVQPEQIEALLGAAYPKSQVVATLTSLGFGVQEESGDQLVVQVPGYRRFDVAHRADLAEEVARVVGYETIPTTSLGGRVPEPRAESRVVDVGVESETGYERELRARRALVEAGLQEVITYSLVEPGQPRRLDAQAPWPPVAETPPDGLIPVVNPLSMEQSALRASLLGSLLETLRSNLRHQERVTIFELARTWTGALDPLPDERRRIGIALAGPRRPVHWSGAPEPLDFFDLKGVVESLCAALHVHATYVPAQYPSLHPGRAASIDIAGTSIGFIGQLHPTVAERYDLEHQAVLVAELDFERLIGAREAVERALAPSRFPSAERDIAVVVDELTSHAELAREIEKVGAPLLAHLQLFDVYRGEPIPAGRKSMAYSLSYQAPDRTLGDEEVAAAHGRIEEALRARFGADVRGR